MYWLITASLGGALQQPTTGKIFGWEKILNLGNSSLKSLEILEVHSLTAKILATTSFFCQRALQVSPDCERQINSNNDRSLMFIPLCLDRVASRLRVFSPSQLWSLKLIFLSSWPVSTANSCIRFAKVPRALSNGVSPSLFARETNAPWFTRSSAISL